jgi:O-methyltransferase
MELRHRVTDEQQNDGTAIRRLVAQEFAALEALFRDAFFMLAFNNISGDYVEFGCCTATTFRVAWRESCHAATAIGLTEHQPPRLRRFWACDSFEGLPLPKHPIDCHPRWSPGTLRISVDEFHRRLATAGIPRSAYLVVPGFYEDTLLDASPAESLPNDISFAYIDCNLYSSAVTVLRFLLSRLKHGMVIALDDYYTYSSDHPSGERQALADVFPFESGWNLVPYRAFGWHGMSFVLEATSGRGSIGHWREREPR